MQDKRSNGARPGHSTSGIRLPMPGPGDVPKDVWASFVANVRRRRGLSQRELARRTGVAQQTISKIENGAICPHDHLKARLAMALGLATADLFPWPSQLGRPMGGVIAWPNLRGPARATATDA